MEDPQVGLEAVLGDQVADRPLPLFLLGQGGIRLEDQDDPKVAPEVRLEGRGDLRRQERMNVPAERDQDGPDLAHGERPVQDGDLARRFRDHAVDDGDEQPFERVRVLLPADNDEVAFLLHGRVEDPLRDPMRYVQDRLRPDPGIQEEGPGFFEEGVGPLRFGGPGQQGRAFADLVDMEEEDLPVVFSRHRLRDLDQALDRLQVGQGDEDPIVLALQAPEEPDLPDMLDLPLRSVGSIDEQTDNDPDTRHRPGDAAVVEHIDG